MLIDLHTHTTASDGQYTPSEVVQMAVNKGISLLAISDHDTVSGIEEGEIEAQKHSLVFVPAIEISAQDIEEIHILGYGIDRNNPALQDACSKWQDARKNRGKVIRDYLTQKGIYIDLDEVMSFAKGQSLGRPHFAQYLLAHNVVSSRKEAFDKYLDTEEFIVATDRKKPSPKEAIDLIHKAGGKAVLAHPGIYHLSRKQMDDLIYRLVKLGIDAIECFYSKHSEEQIRDYLSYIKMYNIKTGCGSDYHGELVKPDIEIGMDYDLDQYGDRLIIEYQ